MARRRPLLRYHSERYLSQLHCRGEVQTRVAACGPCAATTAKAQRACFADSALPPVSNARGHGASFRVCRFVHTDVRLRARAETRTHTHVHAHTYVHTRTRVDCSRTSTPAPHPHAQAQCWPNLHPYGACCLWLCACLSFVLVCVSPPPSVFSCQWGSLPAFRKVHLQALEGLGNRDAPAKSERRAVVERHAPGSDQKS